MSCRIRLKPWDAFLEIMYRQKEKENSRKTSTVEASILGKMGSADLLRLTIGFSFNFYQYIIFRDRE